MKAQTQGESTREYWLELLVAGLRPLFAEQGAEVPEVRVSVGWPHKQGLARSKMRIGECWPSVYAADKKPQIFISPLLEDALQVGTTMAHELIHATVGGGCGHKGPFVKLAKAIGFKAPWTSTPSTPELDARIMDILEAIGPYPHAKLSPMLGRKKQSTRLLKVECPDCGYIVRTTQKWVDEEGLPMCPRGDQMELA